RGEHLPAPPARRALRHLREASADLSRSRQRLVRIRRAAVEALAAVVPRLRVPGRLVPQPLPELGQAPSEVGRQRSTLTSRRVTPTPCRQLTARRTLP